MRCEVCYRWMYPFDDIFDKKPMKMYSLCESCYVKHPVYFDIETLPNEESLIHIMHIHYDGVYKIYAYAFIEDACINFLIYKDVTIIITSHIKDTLLEALTECNFGIIWVFNYHTTQ